MFLNAYEKHTFFIQNSPNSGFNTVFPNCLPNRHIQEYKAELDWQYEVENIELDRAVI